MAAAHVLVSSSSNSDNDSAGSSHSCASGVAANQVGHGGVCWGRGAGVA
jgi:hypothetical protein